METKRVVHSCDTLCNLLRSDHCNSVCQRMEVYYLHCWTRVSSLNSIQAAVAAGRGVSQGESIAPDDVETQLQAETYSAVRREFQVTYLPQLYCMLFILYLQHRYAGQKRYFVHIRFYLHLGHTSRLWSPWVNCKLLGYIQCGQKSKAVSDGGPGRRTHARRSPGSPWTVIMSGRLHSPRLFLR